MEIAIRREDELVKHNHLAAVEYLWTRITTVKILNININRSAHHSPEPENNSSLNLKGRLNNLLTIIVNGRSDCNILRFRFKPTKIRTSQSRALKFTKETTSSFKGKLKLLTIS